MLHYMLCNQVTLLRAYIQCTMYLQLVFSGFGSDAYYGVRFTVGAKIMEMKGYVKVEPYGGVSAYGELGIGFLLYGKLKLVGQIMDTGFPTTAEVTFSKFPLDVK